MKTFTAIDKVLCLQNVDIFKHATTEMLAYIGSIADEVEASKDQVIFREEDVSDAMYAVVAGRVRLDKAGREVMIVGAGESFGSWALFDMQARVMTATALEDAHLLKIRSEDFYDLLSDHDEVTPVIFRAVIERINKLINQYIEKPWDTAGWKLIIGNGLKKSTLFNQLQQNIDEVERAHRELKQVQKDMLRIFA
jgi:CRP-like cAMP-binding protein